jgi:hypothetical protein
MNWLNILKTECTRGTWTDSVCTLHQIVLKIRVIKPRAMRRAKHLKGRNHLGEQAVYVKIILKWILKK